MEYYILINFLKCVILEFLYKFINIFCMYCILYTQYLIGLETNYLLINICKILQIVFSVYYYNISV